MGTFPKSVKNLVYCHRQKWLTRTVVGVTYVCLSATLSTRFFWEPQFGIGTISETDIRAHSTTEAVDPESSRQAKELARQEVPQVYRLDPEVNASIKDHLQELVLLGDQLRRTAGKMPYVSTNTLTYDVQIHLRSIDDPAWQNLQEQVLTIPETSRSKLEPYPTANSIGFVIASRARTQLWHYRSISKVEDYQTLVKEIDLGRQRYRSTLPLLANSLEVFRTHLLDLRDLDWAADKDAMRKALDDLLAAGIVTGVPQEMQQYRLANHRYLPDDLDRKQISIGMLSKVLRPNLQPDYLATKLQADKITEDIPLKYINVRRGELIAKAGQKITEREFALLDSQGLTQRRPNFVGIAAISTSVAISMLIFAVVNLYWSKLLQIKLKIRDVAAIAMVCTGTALAGVLIGANGITFVPLAAVGLMVGSFYGNRLATLTTVLFAVPLAIAINATVVGYIPILVGAIVASVFTNRPHSRSHLAVAGLAVGATQSGVYTTLALVIGTVDPFSIVTLTFQYAAGGLISSVVALGAIPYLEQICYTLTPIRLAELANLDRPLLRRLVTEAPGTFQHTMFVANLAEAGARELGADTALVRTGTLYHDIGKTIRPEFFIENQMGQPNPHDILDDPWRSAQIIKEHVTGGLKLAQKFHLPPILQTFIPEHQGTITISYFYHQAKNRSNEYVEESDFRYEGPIPQSRETGIVMLADACEAALRSLGSDTTEEAANQMLMRIFQARWDDGQLDDAELTQADLQKIAPVFIRVWRERNHGRIKYPDLAKKLDPTGSALPDEIFANNLRIGSKQTT